ncbi:PREDICTED: uncharacterized protein LOC109190244 isoform X2 [Ipomoea nil]|uniref:uncharacterized protein LOC109190244 isoform X2 n=1 Tax=Ipomoea nil TaxID=35883 RepID=UPI0009012C31|nr:PREDICTED: uncharacterized protein LOC109190244 isoform X2 [Ipomoea nil]
MAAFQNLFLFFLAFLFCPPCLSISIHDLLKSKGLPAGLFPKEVSNYTVSESGLLQVFLDEPCLTKFDTMAFYDSVVTANLTHGCLTGVQGFSQEELFVWLPVKDIIVDDPSSGLILIDIGLAHKQLSLSLFEDPPDCKKDGGLGLKKKSRKAEKGLFEAQR